METDQENVTVGWCVVNVVNPQLSLTESEISKIGTIKVEGIINPTNAEMDLKDGVGEDHMFCWILFVIETPRPFILALCSPAAVLRVQAALWRRLEAGSSWMEWRSCGKHRAPWRWHQVQTFTWEVWSLLWMESHSSFRKHSGLFPLFTDLLYC